MQTHGHGAISYVLCDLFVDTSLRINTLSNNKKTIRWITTCTCLQIFPRT